MVHTVAERPASSEGHSKLHDLISRSRKFKLLKGSQNEKGLLKARHAKASQDFHGSDTEGPDGTPSAARGFMRAPSCTRLCKQAARHRSGGKATSNSSTRACKWLCRKLAPVLGRSINAIQSVYHRHCRR